MKTNSNADYEKGQFLRSIDDILKEINLKDEQPENRVREFVYLFLPKLNAVLETEVPCAFRAMLIKEQLKTTAIKLLDAMDEIEQQHENLILTKDKLLQSFIKELARLLDRYIIEKISIEAKQYAIDHNLPKNLLIKHSMAEYKAFMRQYSKNPSSFYEKYPQLFEFINLFCTNFIKNINKMLLRIGKDLLILKEGFFPEFHGPLRLFEAKASHSDLHKNGQQVFILEFRDFENSSCRVVYKPSSVEPDTLLTGNVEKLKQLDPSYNDHFSIVEILNSQLQHKLPTYHIIPRVDTSELSAIPQVYGYIEFLHHRPESNIDYELICKAMTIKCNQDDYSKYIKLVEDTIWRHFYKLYRNAAKNGADFIIKDEAQLKKYSWQCGAWIAISQIFGIADLHNENGIYNGNLNLLDLECCFSFQTLKIQDILCLDPEIGLMRGSARLRKCYSLLFDITGTKRYFFSTPSNNVLWMIKNNELVARDPNVDDLCMGYEECMKALVTLSEKIELWFKLPHVLSMHIRIVPVRTFDFEKELNNLCDENFTIEEFESGVKKFFSLDYENYKRYLAEHRVNNNNNNNNGNDNNFRNLKLPKIAIYSSENRISIYKQYCGLNIPYYSATVNRRQLYDAYGECVIVPAELSFERISSDNFFPITPLYFIQTQAFTMLKQARISAQLIRETREEIRDLMSLVCDLEFPSIFVYSTPLLPASSSATQRPLSPDNNNNNGNEIDEKSCDLTR